MIVQLDKASFEKFLNGDEQVFGALITGYTRPLTALVRQIVGRQDVAECIVAETFYKLWQNRARMREPWHIQNFLFVTARHGAIDHQRERDRSGKLGEVTVGDMAYLETIVREEDSDQAWFYAELEHRLIMERIKKEVEALSPKRRQVFRLYWEEGKSVDEIAEAMDIKPSTVYNQLAAAYKKIRNGLGGTWLDPGA